MKKRPSFNSNKYGDELAKIAKLFAASSASPAANHLTLQTFRHTVSAESTTDKTFSETVDTCEVLGGYIDISGANADFEFDVGYTGATNAFLDDAGSGSNGLFPLDSDYLDSNEDVILTINSNSSTTAIEVEVVLLTVAPVSS